MNPKVKKGPVSEIEVIKCGDKLLMAVFWSFNQSYLPKLMGTDNKNQEMDVIILLAKQRKLIIIEVKSEHLGKVPSKALTTLEHAKQFADNLFNIVGIKKSENWEYIPLVALPNVQCRDKLTQKSQLYHILTKTEFKKELFQVIDLKKDEYEDVSSYKTILSLLAASYHANALKTDSTGVKFEIANLVLQASSKLAGKAQIQAGFDASEKIKNTVSFTELNNAPLVGMKGFMFWNRKQVEILMKMEEHEREGKPCIIAGGWGTGKTLLLASKAIKLSSENKKVIFISNLDSIRNKVDRKHFVLEEAIKLNFSNLEKPISFITMKD